MRSSVHVSGPQGPSKRALRAQKVSSMITPEEARAAIEKAKARHKQEQQDATERRKRPFIYKGIDLEAEIGRMQRILDQYRAAPPPGSKIRKMMIRIRHSAKQGSSGRANCWRVVVTLGHNTTVAVALELILHELCHAALPVEEHHGERFISLLVRVARELWDVDVLGWQGIKRGSYSRRAYVVDELIRAELQQRLDKGDYVPAQAPPPPLVKTPAQKRQERKAAREDHARRMLEEHLRRLRAERQLVSKWRGKVAYYERMAAARRAP